MHLSRMSSRYSIFNFRHLCEITGFNPDGSPRASKLHSVSAGPLNQRPESKETMLTSISVLQIGPDQP